MLRYNLTSIEEKKNLTLDGAYSISDFQITNWRSPFTMKTLYASLYMQPSSCKYYSSKSLVNSIFSYTFHIKRKYLSCILSHQQVGTEKCAWKSFVNFSCLVAVKKHASKQLSKTKTSKLKVCKFTGSIYSKRATLCEVEKMTWNFRNWCTLLLVLCEFLVVKVPSVYC